MARIPDYLRRCLFWAIIVVGSLLTGNASAQTLPINLRTGIAGNVINLFWDPVPRLWLLRFYDGPGCASDSLQYGESRTDQSWFFPITAQPGVDYTFSARGYDGNFQDMGCSNVTLPAFIPINSPQYISGGQMLTWREPYYTPPYPPSISRYDVFRGRSCDAAHHIGSVAGDVRQFAFPTPYPTLCSDYSIHAVGANGHPGACGSISSVCQSASLPIVDASDGTYVDRIRVSWNSDSRFNFAAFRVYRTQILVSSSAYQAAGAEILLTTVGGSGQFVDDYSPLRGTYYFYRVVAVDASGATLSSRTFSPASPGDAALGYIPLAAPQGVQASDGSSSYHVSIQWSHDISSMTYRLVRLAPEAPCLPTSSSIAVLTASQCGTTLCSFNDSTAQPGERYQYHVIAGNNQVPTSSACSAGNEGFRASAPGITSQPQSVSVLVNSPASFSVQASGIELQYQWYRNGAAISGATSSTLQLNSVQASDNGTSFRVRVLNGAGNIDSISAILSVSAASSSMSSSASLSSSTSQASSISSTASSNSLSSNSSSQSSVASSLPASSAASSSAASFSSISSGQSSSQQGSLSSSNQSSLSSAGASSTSSQSSSAGSESPEPPEPACSDGLDNDSDGLIDWPTDPGCADGNDSSEQNQLGPSCDDGIDNDGDGPIDLEDQDCQHPSDGSEGTLPPEVTCRLLDLSSVNDELINNFLKYDKLVINGLNKIIRGAPKTGELRKIAIKRLAKVKGLSLQFQILIRSLPNASFFCNVTTNCEELSIASLKQELREKSMKLISEVRWTLRGLRRASIRNKRAVAKKFYKKAKIAIDVIKKSTDKIPDLILKC